MSALAGGKCWYRTKNLTANFTLSSFLDVLARGITLLPHLGDWSTTRNHFITNRR